MYEKNGSFVLAMRGTDGLLTPDWAANFTQIAGIQINNQYDFALIVANFASLQFGSTKITLTGHSLGGGLAQYVASQSPSMRAITFNSAGINLDKRIPSKLANVVNVRVHLDPVSLIGTQLGSTKYEFSSNSVVSPHSMNNVIKSLENAKKPKTASW